MAKKKAVPVHIPLQTGFGFEVLDREGNAPDFLWRDEDVYAALDAIQQSKWVSTDIESTGLTEASMPVTLLPAEIKQGASNMLRMRTIQARIPTINGRTGPRVNYVFDCDKMSPALTSEVARTILTRPLFLAHNAGFDLYWLRRACNRIAMPSFVVDSMLLTRVLRPELVLVRSEMTSHIKHASEVDYADELTKAAWRSMVSGASGGSLADVVLAMFKVVVDKTYQKPNNWTGLLGFEHHTYAIDDVIWADRIACELFGVGEDGDLYQGYMGARARKKTVRLVEPQVPELVELREHGMPVNTNVGHRYVVRKRAELAQKVAELIDLEPSLNAHRENLSNPDAGLDDNLKKALATAFESRGVILRKTAATGSAQVGEKDLRACKAAQIETSRPLFNAWVAVCRAKKTSAMALEVVGFAERGPDGKVRSLLSHGPVTGRLSAAEPNCQQWPRDQLFRAMLMSGIVEGCELFEITVTPANQPFVSEVLGTPTSVGLTVKLDTTWATALYFNDKLNVVVTEDNKSGLEKYKGKEFNLGQVVSADFGGYAASVENGDKERKELGDALAECFTHEIVASDFGALDVRVGAALCIRSIREMHLISNGATIPGPVQPPREVVAVIRDIIPLLDTVNAVSQLERKVAYYKTYVERLERRIVALKEKLEEGSIDKRHFYKSKDEIHKELLAHKLGYRLSQCMHISAQRGEREYSALRDAFVADIDIHTFTGMKLVGRDPMKEFEGLSVPDRKALEKKLKKELGPRRQQGKIANLSLLYGMADAGFQEAAARGYDEHWTMEEAHDIRALWMDAYPEVELWHLWTECLQVGTVYVAEMGKDKPVRSGWWMARTLANREIVAFGLNAALSYQDQSTGADILALIMHRLKTEYPHIFDTAINQVHDELVLMFPFKHRKEYLTVVETVMVEEANSLTMPYGVPCAVSPACGPIWIKD